MTNGQDHSSDAEREHHGEAEITAKTQIRLTPTQLVGVCGFVLGAGVWCYGVKQDIGTIKTDIAGMKQTTWQSIDTDQYRDLVQGGVEVWEEKLERSLSDALGKPFVLPRFVLPRPFIGR